MSVVYKSLGSQFKKITIKVGISRLLRYSRKPSRTKRIYIRKNNIMETFRIGLAVLRRLLLFCFLTKIFGEVQRNVFFLKIIKFP